MSREQYEKDGFGKIGDKGRYGGIVTVVNELAVGTKFHVENGSWDGKIVEIDGVKHMNIAGVRNVSLETDEEFILEITLEEKVI